MKDSIYLINEVLAGKDPVELIEFASELGGTESGLSVIVGEIDKYDITGEVGGNIDMGSVILQSKGKQIGVFHWDKITTDSPYNLYASHADTMDERFLGRYLGVLGYLALIEYVTNKLKGYIAPFGSYFPRYTTDAAYRVWESLDDSGFVDSKMVMLSEAESFMYLGQVFSGKKTKIEVYRYIGDEKILGGILPTTRAAKPKAKKNPKEPWLTGWQF